MSGKKQPPRYCSVPECANKHFCKGFCMKHYQRWAKHGSPDVFNFLGSRFTSPEERFAARVNKSPGLGPNGDCWEWTGSYEGGPGTRYGILNYQGRRIRATRFSLFLATGQMSEKWILHSCDNTLCVNPRHLREGTAKENSRDMLDRKRGLHQIGKRENWESALCTLRANDVRRIRARLADGERQIDIARGYGIDPSVISNISRGKAWRRVA